MSFDFAWIHQLYKNNRDMYEAQQISQQDIEAINAWAAARQTYYTGSNSSAAQITRTYYTPFIEDPIHRKKLEDYG